MGGSVSSVVNATTNAVTLGQYDNIEGVIKGVSGYGAYSEAKKEAKRQEEALAAEKVLRDEQDAMVKEKQRVADAANAERTGRMSKGRTGLLSASATGVTDKSGILGG